MSNQVSILAFAGSTRTGSFNDSLVRIAARGAIEAGASVRIVSLKDYPMPLYDGDLEKQQGLPHTVKGLKEYFRQADGFLLASPEYNSSISPLMKNTLDWLSRPEGARPMLEVIKGKHAALCSASPGFRGGERGLAALRSMLTNCGVTVLADQVTIAGAHMAFNENGNLKEAKLNQNAMELGRKLAETLKKLKG